MAELVTDDCLDLIIKLTDELEASINAEYRMGQGQRALLPVEQRRYLRDMETVRTARVFIEANQPKE
jgi:hypothetical protein